MPGAPAQIQPESLADYFEVITRAVFQSGISWRVIDAKWDGFAPAFEGFDPHKVAEFDAHDVERLMSDTQIVRNRRKIEATISNADVLLQLDAQNDGFANWLGSHGSFESTSGALQREFKFLGPTGIYYFLYVVGEDVPPHEEFEASRRK